MAYKVTLVRTTTASTMPQFRGMADMQAVEKSLVLEADTKSHLDQMIEQAAVDGWRKK